jgi:hypothetical protein
MIQAHFDDWQTEPPPAAHSASSPNLLLVLGELQRRWPFFFNLGCYGVRPVRGGTVPSSHCYGAAIDCGYTTDDDPLIASLVAPWLVARSGELHVDAIHDYRRSRIWRAERTPDAGEACTTWWKAQRPDTSTGMGQSWANHLHLECTVLGWADEAPVSGRWTE